MKIKKPSYSPEVKERAIRMYLECKQEHPSQWSALVSIASKIGCSPDSLRTWVRQHEIDNGKLEGLSSTERQRMKELERELRELRQANEILRKASAYFAQAELDRPSRK
jgi:Transposase and inactivated derivatives